MPTLVDDRPTSVIIHIGSNDITKSNYKNVNTKELAERIANIGLKCRMYGVRNIAVSSILVRNDPLINEKVNETNFYLKEFCNINGLHYICNNNICSTMLWKDGLHLSNKGTTVLSNSFLQYFGGSPMDNRSPLDNRSSNVEINYLD